MMKRYIWLPICAVCWLTTLSTAAGAASQPPDGDTKTLQGERRVMGTVEEIKSNQIQVDTGEVQPRYIPLNQAKEKGLPEIKQGDRLEITVNDQNLIVDYHLVNESGRSLKHAGHQVIKGQIAQPLVIGHDEAVIKTDDGKEVSYVIRSQARSKMASIPVGTEAIFMVDESNKIVDVNFASSEVVNRAGEIPEKKSPIKGAQQRILGTIVKPLEANQITIRTQNGTEQPFEVRSLVQDKMDGLSKGQAVVLLVDGENKVVDVAIPPAEKGAR